MGGFGESYSSFRSVEGNKVVLPRPYELHMNSKAVSGGEQEK